MPKDFESLPHTADIKIRVYGATLKELFAHAVVGMFQSVGPQAIGCRVEHERLVCDALPCTHDVQVRSIDRESLLVDFLSELLYLSDVNNEAYLAADIHQLTDTYIKATVYGVKITGFQVVEIKAVTYHDLHITDVDGVWQADIVFDI